MRPRTRDFRLSINEIIVVRGERTNSIKDFSLSHARCQHALYSARQDVAIGSAQSSPMEGPSFLHARCIEIGFAPTDSPLHLGHSNGANHSNGATEPRSSVAMLRPDLGLKDKTKKSVRF